MPPRVRLLNERLRMYSETFWVRISSRESSLEDAVKEIYETHLWPEKTLDAVLGAVETLEQRIALRDAIYDRIVARLATFIEGQGLEDPSQLPFIVIGTFNILLNFMYDSEFVETVFVEREVLDRTAFHHAAEIVRKEQRKRDGSTRGGLMLLKAVAHVDAELFLDKLEEQVDDGLAVVMDDRNDDRETTLILSLLCKNAEVAHKLLTDEDYGDMTLTILDKCLRNEKHRATKYGYAEIFKTLARHEDCKPVMIGYLPELERRIPPIKEWSPPRYVVVLNNALSELRRYEEEEAEVMSVE